MKNIVQRNLIIVSSIAVVLLGVYVYGLIVINQSASRMATLAQDRLFERDREMQLRTVEDVVRRTEEGRQALAGYFLEEEDVVEFITLIEGLASTTQVALNVVSVDVAGSAEQPELQMRLTADGSWRDIFHLLSLLETLPYPSDMSTVALTKTSTNAETGIVQWRSLIDFKTAMLPQ